MKIKNVISMMIVISLFFNNLFASADNIQNFIALTSLFSANKPKVLEIIQNLETGNHEAITESLRALEPNRDIIDLLGQLSEINKILHPAFALFKVWNSAFQVICKEWLLKLLSQPFKKEKEIGEIVAKIVASNLFSISINLGKIITIKKESDGYYLVFDNNKVIVINQQYIQLADLDFLIFNPEESGKLVKKIQISKTIVKNLFKKGYRLSIKNGKVYIVYTLNTQKLDKFLNNIQYSGKNVLAVVKKLSEVYPRVKSDIQIKIKKFIEHRKTYKAYNDPQIRKEIDAILNEIEKMETAEQTISEFELSLSGIIHGRSIKYVPKLINLYAFTEETTRQKIENTLKRAKSYRAYENNDEFKKNIDDALKIIEILKLILPGRAKKLMQFYYKYIREYLSIKQEMNFVGYIEEKEKINIGGKEAEFLQALFEEANALNALRPSYQENLLNSVWFDPGKNWFDTSLKIFFESRRTEKSMEIPVKDIQRKLMDFTFEVDKKKSTGNDRNHVFASVGLVVSETPHYRASITEVEKNYDTDAILKKRLAEQKRFIQGYLYAHREIVVPADFANFENMRDMIWSALIKDGYITNFGIAAKISDKFLKLKKTEELKFSGKNKKILEERSKEIFAILRKFIPVEKKFLLLDPQKDEIPADWEIFDIESNFDLMGINAEDLKNSISKTHIDIVSYGSDFRKKFHHSEQFLIFFLKKNPYVLTDFLQKRGIQQGSKIYSIQMDICSTRDVCEKCQKSLAEELSDQGSEFNIIMKQQFRKNGFLISEKDRIKNNVRASSIVWFESGGREQLDLFISIIVKAHKQGKTSQEIFEEIQKSIETELVESKEYQFYCKNLQKLKKITLQQLEEYIAKLKNIPNLRMEEVHTKKFSPLPVVFASPAGRAIKQETSALFGSETLEYLSQNLLAIYRPKFVSTKLEVANIFKKYLECLGWEVGYFYNLAETQHNSHLWVETKDGKNILNMTYELFEEFCFLYEIMPKDKFEKLVESIIAHETREYEYIQQGFDKNSAHEKSEAQDAEILKQFRKIAPILQTLIKEDFKTNEELFLKNIQILADTFNLNIENITKNKRLQKVLIAKKQSENLKEKIRILYYKFKKLFIKDDAEIVYEFNLLRLNNMLESA